MLNRLRMLSGGGLRAVTYALVLSAPLVQASAATADASVWFGSDGRSVTNGVELVAASSWTFSKPMAAWVQVGEGSAYTPNLVTHANTSNQPQFMGRVVNVLYNSASDEPVQASLSLTVAFSMPIDRTYADAGYKTARMSLDAITFGSDNSATIYGSIEGTTNTNQPLSFSGKVFEVLPGNVSTTGSWANIGAGVSLDLLRAHMTDSAMSALAAGLGWNVNSLFYTALVAGAQNVGSFNVTLTPTSVPEPSSAWLLGLGLLGLMSARRVQCRAD